MKVYMISIKIKLSSVNEGHPSYSAQGNKQIKSNEYVAYNYPKIAPGG